MTTRGAGRNFVAHVAPRHVDDIKDGKTNKTRQVGMKARLPGTKDQLKDATGLAIWCVCGNFKVDKGANTYLGHWRSCYGPRDVSAMHPNMLERGSTYAKPVFASLPRSSASASAKRGPAANAVAAESKDTGKIAAVLEMGEVVTKKCNKIIGKSTSSRRPSRISQSSSATD